VGIRNEAGQGKGKNKAAARSGGYFSQAQKLYEYIEAIEKLLPDVQDDKQAELIQYLSLARQKADWLNPLVGRVDEVLGIDMRGL
jgi:hypothetical protein